MAVDGQTKSREALLGQPLAKSVNNEGAETRRYVPGLLKCWGEKEGALPTPGTQWLVRMDRSTRLQLFLCEALRSLQMGGGDDFAHLQAQGLQFRMKRPRAEVFRGQVNRVESWAALRAERSTEILSQLQGQHPYWSGVLHLNPELTPYTNELLMVAMQFAACVVHTLKYRFACPRPSDYSPRVQPMIENPGFFAFPSGHATQAFMAAELLCLLTLRADRDGPFRETRTQLMRLADRVATNRVVAGVHFPIDSEAGCHLGLVLARFLAGSGSEAGVGALQRLAPGAGQDWDAERCGYSETRDFSHRQELDHQSVFGADARVDLHPIADAARRCRPNRREPLQWLWAQAQAEWHEPGIE